MTFILLAVYKMLQLPSKCSANVNSKVSEGVMLVLFATAELF